MAIISQLELVQNFRDIPSCNLSLMLTVVVSLGKMVRVQSVIVLIHRTIQQVFWIVTHELSDPGEEKKISSSPDMLKKCSDQASVVSTMNTRWLCMIVLVLHKQPTMIIFLGM